MIRPQPKPDPRAPKARRPLRAKHWGTRPVRKLRKNPTAGLAFPKPEPKRGTAHARRPREMGFMAFCHARGCELCLDPDMRKVVEIPRCSGRLEFAHLSDKKRYDVGDVGACLHWSVHKGVDGKTGGKGPWYVALGRSGQHLFRMRLANRARSAWDALTPEQRADWDARAAAQHRRSR